MRPKSPLIYPNEPVYELTRACYGKRPGDIVTLAELHHYCDIAGIPDTIDAQAGVLYDDEAAIGEEIEDPDHDPRALRPGILADLHDIEKNLGRLTTVVLAITILFLAFAVSIIWISLAPSLMPFHPPEATSPIDPPNGHQGHTP